MSRQRRLRDRVRRAHWLQLRTVSRRVMALGWASEELTWRRALPRGLWLPYWRGMPLVSHPLRMGGT